MNTCPDLSRRCVDTYRQCRSVDRTCAILGVHPITVWRAIKFSGVGLDAGTILKSESANVRAWHDAERAFAHLVPDAESANDLGLNNPGFDFMLQGWRIEIKFCAPTARQKWTFQFCRSYQRGPAVLRTDFFVAFLNQSPELDLDSCVVLVIPAELIGDRKVFSWSCKRPATHWSRFILPATELHSFFSTLPDKQVFESTGVHHEEQTHRPAKPPVRRPRSPRRR